MSLFKNLIAYRIGPDWTAPAQADLEALLNQLRFLPCEPSQAESAGWVSPRPVEHAALVEAQSGSFLMKLAVERKSVPGSVIKSELEKRCKALFEERGRSVGRKEKKELKEEIHREFLARVFSKRSSHLVWLDMEARALVVGTGSRTASDQVINHLTHVMATLGRPLQVAPIFTIQPPEAAMAEWLRTKTAPEGFTVDRDLELKQPDSDKSVVRYVRHNLELDEITQHIESGKRPTQLAMTWDARVSFMLTEDFTFKKLELLKVAEGENAADSFDADFAIAIEELGPMIPAIITAMGGEKPMFDTKGAE